MFHLGFRSPRPRFFELGLVAALVSACAAGGTGESGGGGSGGDGGSGAAGAAGPSTTGGSGGEGGFGGFPSGGSGGGEDLPAEVFGHSDTTLYKLNPDTKAVGIIGPFQGCATEVVDIALDADSNFFATTYDGLYRVNKATAQCTLVAEGDYPNSLSFVPAGTLDPNKEALVGFVDDQYVRINPDTGAITNIGQPWDNGFKSSGDVVSVKNGPTYLTIKDFVAADMVCADCLVEINPANGAIIENFGSIGYAKVFGTAFWAGSVYGFTNDGALFEITLNNGNVNTILIEQSGSLKFWGAGSTTSAPPVPQ